MIRVPVEEESRVLLSEGPHLFRIVGVGVVNKKDRDILKLRLLVLAGPSPAGTMTVEEMHLTPDAIKRVGILAKRLGLIERGTNEVQVDLDEQQLVGKEVVAVIGHEGWTNNKGEMVTISKWKGFADFWAPNDDRSPLRANSYAARPHATTQVATPQAAPQTDWSNV